ncbi:MAG: hypothetical protein ACTS43_01145 [Candidatus Hodgkinia cicadicola]
MSLARLAVARSQLTKYFLRLGVPLSNPPFRSGGASRTDLTTSARAPKHQPPSGLSFKTGLVERPERYTDLGRHLTFEQFDVDVLDVPDLTSELNTLSAAHMILKLFDLSQHTNLVMGSMLLLTGLCEVCGVLRNSVKRKALIIVLDKTLAFPIRDLIDRSGHHAPSGVTTSSFNINFPPKFASLASQIVPTPGAAQLNNLNAAYLSLIGSHFGESGVKELLWLRYVQRSLGPSHAVVVHPLLARGATYYNGIIFEALSNFVCMTGRNRFVKVGSLLGGGRYDGFYKTSHLRRSVGCSLGLSRTNDYIGALRRPFTSMPRRPRVLISLNQFNTSGGALSFKFSSDWMFNLVANLNTSPPFATRRQCEILLIKTNGGWLCKDFRRTRRLQPRITCASTWRNLSLNISWLSINALLRSLRLPAETIIQTQTPRRESINLRVKSLSPLRR